MNDTRAIIWGEKAEAIQIALEELDEDLAKLIVDVAYRDVFTRPGLDLKTRELLAVSHLISVGSAGELETHIRGALNCGATESEIRETIIHAALFIGFPRVVSAMKVFKDTLSKLR